jgi:hypothetical protein
VTFLVQFIRFRRGVPEVVRTLRVVAPDGSVALAWAKKLVGTSFWPTRTEALRGMDDGGRTLIDWIVPDAAAQSYPSFPLPSPREPTDEAPRPISLADADEQPINPAALGVRHHHFDVGQPIS